nr:outer membrane beta-barrel protein [Sphingomonas sp. Y57]
MTNAHLKKSIISVFVGSFTLGVASPALAEGLTGANVEVRLGYERLDEIGNPDGVTYGFRAGYQAPLSKDIVIGFDVGLDSSTTEYFGLSKSHDLSAMLKIGPRIGENSLIYVTGGYSRMKVKNFGSLNGWRAGVGWQQAISKSFYIGFEGNYTRYNEFNIDDNMVTLLAGLRL